VGHQKRFDAGLPDAQNGGRGRRNGRVDGRVFPGLRGGLFSGQAYAPEVNGWSGLTSIVCQGSTGAFWGVREASRLSSPDAGLARVQYAWPV
jgi:hypothetical protein